MIQGIPQIEAVEVAPVSIAPDEQDNSEIPEL